MINFGLDINPSHPPSTPKAARSDLAIRRAAFLPGRVDTLEALRLWCLDEPQERGGEGSTTTCGAWTNRKNEEEKVVRLHPRRRAAPTLLPLRVCASSGNPVIYNYCMILGLRGRIF